jgi:chaperonin GroEL
MKKEAKVIGNKADFMEKVIKAVETIATPVKATLGPDGLPILLQREKTPLITKDGVTVAKSIVHDDPVFNTMIQAIREASERTNEEVGDGTTTAVVLVESLIKEGMKFIKADLITPQALVREIKACVPSIISQLDNMSKKIESEEEIKYVAMISSNSDKEIAERVTEAVVKAGADGVTSIEPGSGAFINVKTIGGFQIGKGWGAHKEHALKMLSASGKQEISFGNTPALLCYNGEITDIGEFGEFLMAFNEIDENNPVRSKVSQLVVIAHSFGHQIRQMVADNFAVNGLPVMLVETESWSTENSKVLLLHDLAVITGGKVVQHGNIRSLIKDKTTVDDDALGCCDKVVQVKGLTTFYGGEGSKESVLEHVELVRKQMADAEHPWDEGVHRKRIARLLGGITVLECGGITPLEIKEKMDRVTDAVSATRAALKGGVVPGGGKALLNCVSDMLCVSCGAKVMRNVLLSPIRQIIMNTGESPDIIVGQLLKDPTVTYGYDALNRTMVDDMFKSGIIDPLLVVKTAFNNAVSIGCEMLRGGGYVVYKKDGATADPEEQMASENPTDIT